MGSLQLLGCSLEEAASPWGCLQSGSQSWNSLGVFVPDFQPGAVRALPAQPWLQGPGRESLNTHREPLIGDPWLFLDFVFGSSLGNFPPGWVGVGAAAQFFAHPQTLPNLPRCSRGRPWGSGRGEGAESGIKCGILC